MGKVGRGIELEDGYRRERNEKAELLVASRVRTPGGRGRLPSPGSTKKSKRTDADREERDSRQEAEELRHPSAVQEVWPDARVACPVDEKAGNRTDAHEERPRQRVPAPQPAHQGKARADRRGQAHGRQFGLPQGDEPCDLLRQPDHRVVDERRQGADPPVQCHIGEHGDCRADRDERDRAEAGARRIVRRPLGHLSDDEPDDEDRQRRQQQYRAHRRQLRSDVRDGERERAAERQETNHSRPLTCASRVRGRARPRWRHDDHEQDNRQESEDALRLFERHGEPNADTARDPSCALGARKQQTRERQRGRVVRRVRSVEQPDGHAPDRDQQAIEDEGHEARGDAAREHVHEDGHQRLQRDERQSDDAQVHAEELEERAIHEEHRGPVELVEPHVRHLALGDAPARVDDLPLVHQLDGAHDGAVEVERREAAERG